MSNAAAFKSITVNYVYGVPTDKLSKEQLIGAIKQVEADIGSLDAVATKSTAIDAEKANLKDQLAQIVKELDSRP